MNIGDLEYTDEIKKATDDIYQKVKDVIPPFEWPVYAPFIHKINQLKKEKNAVILAHNYMTPEIFHGIADITGDSLALAREAVNIKADIVVLCGVHFMAETVKILNPSKTVLIPDLDAGCSLAESITPEDVRALRKKYPGVPVVTYVNTSAAVKAEVDICCTSGNAKEVVESLDADEILFLPDQYLAANIQKETGKKLITWPGSCEVHERFTAKEILDYKESYKDLVVIAHPECPSEVVEAADYAGSTSGMISFVKEKKPAKVLMVTECSMSDNVAANTPDVQFIRPCNLCPHMKRITLPKILKSLTSLEPQVELDQDMIEKAKGSIEKMLAVKSR
ncbi:quinolinate synthase NadA [Spirochaeta cellobiosiphila]|uniref:quinolinate synthase NadA n=1 Tax=Spirochaeta cellobiosiphila TaxID=504483 RepID=UPI000410997F|nr:quinolinate synthase NadA [Spirochaeta cellobiosiphila]